MSFKCALQLYSKVNYYFTGWIKKFVLNFEIINIMKFKIVYAIRLKKLTAFCEAYFSQQLCFTQLEQFEQIFTNITYKLLLNISDST